MKIYQKNKTHFSASTLLFLSSLYMSHVFACGYYLENGCMPPNPCQTNLGLSLDSTGSKCILTDMGTWSKYPIDGSRGNFNGMNYWKYDDLVRDQLNMDSSQLEYAQPLFDNQQPSLELAAHDRPQNGRYIYVIRTADGKMVMRRNDRVNPSSILPMLIRFDYTRFRNPNNFRSTATNDVNATALSSKPCTLDVLFKSGQYCVYKHVRHTQLNGTKSLDGTVTNAWDPVYCAGELRVHNGKIDIINNASGHFKPAATCVSNVITLLKALDIPVDTNVKFGDYHTFDTSELFICSQDAPMEVPAGQQACSYTSEDTIGEPVYPGSFPCAYNPQGIWVWSRNNFCNGTIYSLGAEY